MVVAVTCKPSVWMVTLSPTLMEAAEAEKVVSKMMLSSTRITGMMVPAVSLSVSSRMEMYVGAVVPEARARLPLVCVSAMPTWGGMAPAGRYSHAGTLPPSTVWIRKAMS